MSKLAFTKQFPTNESCKLHFKLEREKECLICKKCSLTEHIIPPLFRTTTPKK